MRTLTTILLLFPLLGFSQVKKPKSLIIELTKDSRNTAVQLSFKDCLSLNSVEMPNSWNLGVKQQQKDYAPITAKNLITIIGDSIENGIKEPDKSFAQYTKQLIDDMNLEHFKSTPYQICTNNSDGYLIDFIGGCVSKDILNTQNLSANQRASHEITSWLLPKLKQISGHLKNLQFKYIALGLTYGSENFAKKEDSLELKSEYLCILCPIETVKKFANYEITPNQLIQKSGIFLKERDDTTINKILIDVE